VEALADVLSLEHLYLAYRKAKADAFYENTHFHALAFADYEKDLDRNLRKLLTKLLSKRGDWSRDPAIVTGFTYAPKSVSARDEGNGDGMFYRLLDPREEWRRMWPGGNGRRATAQFRLMITPTVDFHVISALWILMVGQYYEAVLDPSYAYGNRLRRRRPQEGDELGPLNLDCIGLFPPYFGAYSKWRENGLDAIRDALKARQRILAVTMDLRNFYHRVSPRFLLRPSFLDAIGLQLTDLQALFTKRMIGAMEAWYQSTPDYRGRPEGALPVGLSASKIIANVLLAEFDRQIVRECKPVYYGRYVDDVFLVLRSTRKNESGITVMRDLAKAMPAILRFEQKPPEGAALRVAFTYAPDSDLLFAGGKQKIFNLSGEYGLDLISQISAQIRQHSSEHRLLATVPETSIEMASRALLAQSAASLEADAIRKADVVSVRRLGLALLLRDVEAYARDLHPKEWVTRRREFYGLIHRQVLTPIGYFDYFGYTHRVLGLMVASGDLPDAIQLLRSLKEIGDLIESTTTAGTTQRREFEACRRYYAHALNQVILQATTVTSFRWPRMLMQVFNTLRLIDPNVPAPERLASARRLSSELLYADWGRRPYRDQWLSGASRRPSNPPVPAALGIRKMLRLGAIRAFRKAADLRLPYWPAVVFPTRPVSLSEITLAAPQLLTTPHYLRSALFAFRGARARSHEGVAAIDPPSPFHNREILVDGSKEEQIRVAVPSFLTTRGDWDAAVAGKPALSLARYERTRRLVNRVLREGRGVHYLVFPECSLPFGWAKSIAVKLAERGISLIAGLEYRLTHLGVRNDAFLSLATAWPWHATSVFFIQPKCAPAHQEKRELYKQGRKRLFRPLGNLGYPPVYVHGGMCFSVMLCSDLTNISHRGRLQGEIDALFVLEWNKDIDTFSALVEATANDLHAYVVQSNNRQYGDSRIRIPKKRDFQRDVVRVRGGLHDYFVVGALDVNQLRRFQRDMPTSSGGIFKPVPIGYAMSKRREES
jgi:hypothetical protein